MNDVKDPNVLKVIQALNKARAMEIGAIHQYMVQHYRLDGMDYGQLCANMKLIAVDEMRHAEKFAERVDALGGDPACGMDGTIVQGQSVAEIYAQDVGLETNTIKTYDELAEVCLKAGDTLTASLFNDIIKEEEVHLTYYKETEEHLKTLGTAFLAKYAATSKHTGPVKSFVKVMAKEEF